MFGIDFNTFLSPGNVFGSVHVFGSVQRVAITVLRVFWTCVQLGVAQKSRPGKGPPLESNISLAAAAG